MELSDYREKINAIDEQLTALFVQRMAVSAEIAAYKRAHALPVLDSAREAQKLADVEAQLPEELRPYGKELYALLFDLSRRYQRAQGGVM